MKKVNIALIGYGYLGKWHAEKANRLKYADLVAIVDPSEESKKLASEKYPGVKVCSGISGLQGQIDAVIIATPTSKHFELIQHFLGQEVHVFCEKPMTATLEEALEIDRLLKSRSKKNKIIFQVGHSERFHEIWESPNRFSDFLIPPFSLKIARYAPFKGRATDVDVVQDLMIHDLDLLTMLTPLKIASVNSIGFKSLTEKWDYVESDLNLEQDSKCTIIVGRHATEEVRKVEMTNKNGTAMIDLANYQFSWTEGKNLKSETFAKRDHLMLEQEEFIKSIHSGVAPRIGIREGLSAIQDIDRVLRSLGSQDVP